ncbi:MAG: peptidoglycan DD-metalloendopeptidase family protein [Oscillospiraceae bacterium]
MNIKVKKIISCIMIMALVFACVPVNPPVSAASTIEETTQKRNDLQAQLIEINRKLASIKDDVKKAQAKTETYSSRKSLVQDQIEAIKETIELKESELSLKQEELDLKEKAQQETYELFKKRLRAMYMSNDSNSALSTVLGASTFSEFLVRSEVMRKVSEHDTELIDKLVKEQGEIKEAKTVIEDELTSLEEDKATLDSKYSELAALYQEANNTLNTAEALKEVTEDDYETILADFKKTDAELNALMGTGNPDFVGGAWMWPVPGFRYVSSGFGWRTLYGKPNFHGGIDIAGGGIYGAPIVASNSGTVIRAYYGSTGYGYHVMIDHGGNNWTVYGHMSSIAVSYGQYVTQGQTIGYVGSTGNSTGPHLHFEIRLNGSQVNPLNYL